MTSSPIFKKAAVFIAIGCSALLSIAAFVWFAQSQLHQELGLSEPETFDVARGASVNSILREMSAKSWVEYNRLLHLYLRLVPHSYAPKVGHYEALPNMTLHQFLKAVSDGREKTYTITLVEGLTWKQWHQQLVANPVIDNDVSEKEILSRLNIQHAKLEGVLLPETYQVRFGTKLSELVTRLHGEMQEFLEQEWQNRQGMLPLKKPYEALILASIIEKETGVAEERKRIAAVFVNRLRDNMRLQTDPTVIYGLGEQFDGNLTRKHLRQKTPYNTYKISGLPPTPIAMPGKDAIVAALNPALSDEYYFVAKGDGTHHFSQSLKQHNTAVRKYQLGLD